MPETTPTQATTRTVPVTAPVPEALLLDLDETLIDGTGLAAGTLAASVQLAGDFGADANGLAAEAAEAFARQWAMREQDWILGRVDDEEFTAAVWAELLAKRGRGAEDAGRMARLHLAALHAAHAPFPDVIPFLDSARDAGIALAIVTNGSTVAQRAKIDLLGSERFASIVVSGEHGVAKPDPSVFRIALGELGVAPEDAVHVGDDPVSDVAGARAAGIRAVLLDRAGVTPAAGDVSRDLAGVRALLGF